MPASSASAARAAAPLRVVFTGKQQVEIQPFTLDAPAQGQVRVRSECSLMSTGTENIVFNRLFDSGTHWDNWVKYPFFPGYASVGVIEAVGPGVSLKAGDRVVSRSAHASHQVFDAASCNVVPIGIDPRQASWFALAKIAFMGARAAAYSLGDSVVIIGAGPIGQMSVRWAFAAGVKSIIVVDPVAKRLELARAGGATAVVAQPGDQALEAVKAANGGTLPRVVIDGTGHHAVFSSALRFAADRGRVVILGDTGSPAGQHLSSDVISRGLTIVGAHDCHNDATWNGTTITDLFFDLVASGRFRLDGLITHTFPGAEGAKAYEMANQRRGETMGILFDWSQA